MLLHLQDVELLIRNLPNIVLAKRIEAEQFNHNDFLFSTEAKSLIFDELLQKDRSYLGE